MGRPLRLYQLIACLLIVLSGLPAQAANSEQIDLQSADFLRVLRDSSPQAAALLDRASAVLVFPEMVAMGFGDGGRYGEGSLVVAGEYRSNYVTTGEPSDPEAQLILFMDASALKTFQRERSWQSKGEPAQGSVIRLGWQEGDVQLNLPLGGRKFTRVSR